MMLPLLAISAFVSIGAAQTYTSCNPTNTTCDPDTGLKKWSLSTDFTQGSSDEWTAISGNVTYGSNGAEFTINKRYDAPTLETNFYIFFGEVEVVMKAANGTGIVSSIVMESDDLDEIDWECTGTDTTQIETNYFGKGNTTTYDRAIWETVSTPQDEFHTYKVVWTAAAITWYIDGTSVRTLEYADAVDGKNFPQTPMVVKLGIWAGGDSSNSEGTIEWAGGETDYDDVPFTMYVKSVNIINYNPAASYNYTDKTGSYTSIVASNSTTGSGIHGSNSVSVSASSSSTSASTSTSSRALIAAASTYPASVQTSSSGVVSSSASSSSSAAAASSSASASAVFTGAAVSNLPSFFFTVFFALAIALAF
ncbi:probable glycosidase crf1 [Aspergillus lentulus]|uniref:Crh-like protein n=1 Tax=Aspergillus lentulus TaxID=293939 RepID=A0ABQ1AD30_ASPLE|nr:probable glycosidase crf1 [Aspergillus lentulus]GFF54919.1 probable glycosidase crf1 [Aspergillus lentulus]GFF60151.1 probable glycosidase crf1 [Aspergillus lentulus]GFF79250.1 probable glycosidase crf1 [Aspergillus lentulus]